ncbi:MAG: Hsp20/alpha crystallin family protein [Oscillospiraceae bacterium]|nr:Hsp20/alpha crystallin family protein [Oscillospiraceae bacterium]
MFNLIPVNRNNSLFRMFDDLEQQVFTPVTSGSSFRTDILENETSYILQAELPGFRKEDIALDLTDGVLTIAAQRAEPENAQAYLRRERKYGTFSRSFNVSGIREGEITAAFENGVLELTLPKLAPETPPTRRIEIQ